MSLAIAPEKSDTSLEFLDLDRVRVDPAWSLRLPAALAFRQRVLPLCRLDQGVIVACVDPTDPAALRILRKYLETEFVTMRVEPEALRRALIDVYGCASGMTGTSKPRPRVCPREVSNGEAADAVAICDELIQSALLREASDIHLLPNEVSLVVHFRVDGRLELYRELSKELQATVVNRLKVLSGMAIAEKRAPQDGRFTTRVGKSQRKIDVRVATLPTRFGERMTLRLLTSRASTVSLASLGMSDNHLTAFRSVVSRPHGLVLLTGPTGSGKSTTLYAAIEQVLQSRGGNIITVEDPIEYEMRGVSQVEVDSADKVNFSKALRSMLRHDPDVLMIGEIRDAETADVALKASLTGHLVFSTLHTNSATGVVTRLIDMGIERFLVAATLRLSVAQRLVRRLCPHCRRARPMSAKEALSLKRLELEGQTLFEPVGCVYCAGRGFSGRVALFELVESNEEFARLVATGASEDELLSDLRRRSQPLLVDDAVFKLLAGTTDLSEILNAVVAW